MASRAAQKRVRTRNPAHESHKIGHTANDVFTMGQLTREYKSITENPPPYITAHPSETNILE